LIFNLKYVIVAEIDSYLVQPFIKRDRKWTDIKTLFPYWRWGFCFGYPFETCKMLWLQVMARNI
jgi:hypothetical protein